VFRCNCSSCQVVMWILNVGLHYSYEAATSGIAYEHGDA
jgi:hypothetical protein